MVEGISTSHEGRYKHLVEQDLALTKMHSEANFWADMAKGILPEAGKAIDFRTGETWGAIGTGAALGIGLNWMLNAARPAPTRLIGQTISAVILGQGAAYTWQTGCELNSLKNKAVATGDYSGSLHEAQKVSGKFLADNVLGLIGGAAGHLSEPFINHGISRLGGKPYIAQTVSVGAESSRGVFGNTHSVEESPFYMAMSKGRKNKNKQKAFEQKPVEAKPVTNAESIKPVETSKPAEPAKSTEAASNEIDLDPADLQLMKDGKQIAWVADFFRNKEVTASDALNAETLKLLNDQAVRKGKPADVEHFEDLSAIKKQQGREAFDSTKDDAIQIAAEKQFESRSIKQYRKLSEELAALKSAKNDEKLAEMLLDSMDTAVEPHVVEARADRVLKANEIFAQEVRDIARHSPFIRELFLEARSEKYPKDAFVLFTDEKGRLIQYSNDYLADKLFHYPLKDIARGVADFELMSSDIVKGAAIFGSPEGGSRPLLGTIGDVPLRLTQCGNSEGFVINSRLNKPLSQFDFKTGITRELGKAGVPEGVTCKDGVCLMSEEFLAKLKMGKEARSSSKPDGMSTEARPAVSVESTVMPEIKPETTPMAKPQEVPAVKEEPIIVAQEPVAVVQEPVVEPVQQPVVQEAIAQPQTKREAAIARLEKEEKSLLDRMATHEQSELDGIKDGLLNKKERKAIKTRLRQIATERESLGVELVEAPASASAVNPVTTPPVAKRSAEQIAREYMETELEARLQGQPEGIYGPTHEAEATFKAGRKDAQEAHLAKLAEEARIKEAEQVKQESQTTVEAETNQKKFYTEDDHKQLEASLREKNTLIADAFGKAKAGTREIPGDKIVFFVEHEGLIKRVNVAGHGGRDQALMATKLDFHFGKVPVEELNGNIIGWARVGTKIRDKEIVYRQNDRQGGRHNNKPQVDTEVLEVGGDAPNSMRRALEQGKEVSYGDLMRVPGVVPPEMEVFGYKQSLARLQKDKEYLDSRFNQHVFAVENGLVDRVIPENQLEGVIGKLLKVTTEINRLEERIQEASAKKAALQEETTNGASGLEESIQDVSTQSKIGDSVKTEEVKTEHSQSSVLDKDALDPVKPRMMNMHADEKLADSLVQQLNSWKSQVRPKAKPDNKVPSFAEKQDALVHVAYDVNSRAREAFAKGNYADAEAWAASLVKLVKEGQGQRFDELDTIRAASLLGECFRMQKKNNEAESCFKWATDLLKGKEPRPDRKGEVRLSPELELLRASVFESYAKLLRSEPAQSRVREAREMEGKRLDIFERLHADNQDLTIDAGKWSKAAFSTRDRQRNKISAADYAKELERSLNILNWFDITL